MYRVVTFDVESRRGPRTLRPDDEQAGWEELRSGAGGAAAIVLHDTLMKWQYIYDDTRRSLAAAAAHLEAADLVVGFCSERFDIPVLEGILGRNLRLRNHYDIYTEVARACAERGVRTSVGDLKLDTLCKKNLGRGKIDVGSHAETLAAEGRYGELFNYCSDDVHLTYDLFVYICEHGGLHLNGHGWLPLTPPKWVCEQAKE